MSLYFTHAPPFSGNAVTCAALNQTFTSVSTAGLKVLIALSISIVVSPFIFYSNLQGISVHACLHIRCSHLTHRCSQSDGTLHEGQDLLQLSSTHNDNWRSVL